MGSDLFEYESKAKLDEDCRYSFTIPESIICNEDDIGEKRITVFSFFSITRGINYRLSFSINNLVKWAGRKPNRNDGGINDKMHDCIKKLEEYGYIDVFDDCTGSHIANARLNNSYIKKKIDSESFAVLYPDEVLKILSYDGLTSKSKSLNKDIVLLVFAYLRLKITRRPNKLQPEFLNCDGKNNRSHDIENRRLKCPDAYNMQYKDMANELKLNDKDGRIVSKATNILVELGLIYKENLHRVNRDDRWFTQDTIFCNAYKRECGYLLDDGEDYYLREIKNKRKKITAK